MQIKHSNAPTEAAHDSSRFFRLARIAAASSSPTVARLDIFLRRDENTWSFPASSVSEKVIMRPIAQPTERKIDRRFAVRTGIGVSGC